MSSQGNLCGVSRVLLRWLMHVANLLILTGGLVLIGVGVWTLETKSFTEDLLRNSLYLNTAKVMAAVGCFTTIVAVFGFFAAYKEAKVLHLTYFVFISVLLLVLAIGAVLAYVFTEQVDLTMKAEMISDVRHYDPNNPDGAITWAWDTTQQQLECCGMMTAQVNQSWQIWRYSPLLHPDGAELFEVPSSCCIPDALEGCGVFSNNISGLYTKDCYLEAKGFVVAHSSLMGAVAIVVVCIQALGAVSSLVLFKSIV